MTIRRLDVFFRTQLTLDQPQFFNSITNCALAPLQHLVGQKQFDSLKGKVSPCLQVPQTTKAPSCYVETLFKVVVFVCDFFVAIVLTPIGIAARFMSFHSPEIGQAYSTAHFLQLSPSEQGSFLTLNNHTEFSKEFVLQKTKAEYEQLWMHLPLNLIELYKAQEAENTKKESLDDSLSKAIQSLKRLKAKLQAEGAQDPQATQFRNDPLYSFPFYLAKQLEAHPKVVLRADKTLWEKLLSLRKSCLAFLPTDCDDALLETTQAQANATFKASLTSNAQFFKELRGKSASNVETAEIENWIEEKKKSNYSYPFYTQPRILEFLAQTKPPEQLQPFSDILSNCATLLRKKGLQKYISEKPNPDHTTTNALVQAMDQLENISKLQQLIKTQAA